MSDNDTFSLDVSIPADKWAFTNRRLSYLEAVLIQVLRDESRIQEWYDAAQIAAMGLPGLPTSKGGITRLANKQNWLKRDEVGRGGTRFQYHYVSFPIRAFERLISKIIDGPNNYDIDESLINVESLPEIETEPPLRLTKDNTAPPWVLPFMRLMKGESEGNLGKAWAQLPKHLPPDVELPDETEAVKTLMRLGLVHQN